MKLSLENHFSRLHYLIKIRSKSINIVRFAPFVFGDKPLFYHAIFRIKKAQHIFIELLLLNRKLFF